MVPAAAAARLGLAHRRVEELLLVVKAQWRWVRHMVWGRAHVVDALRRSTQATTCGPRERPETAAEPPAALGGPAAPRAPPRRAEMPQVSGEGSEMSQRISKASALRASRGLPGCRGDCHGSRRCPVPVRCARRARSRAWACRGGAPPQSRKWFAGVARFAHHFATQSPWPVWQIFFFFFLPRKKKESWDSSLPLFSEKTLQTLQTLQKYPVYHPPLPVPPTPPTVVVVARLELSAE